MIHALDTGSRKWHTLREDGGYEAHHVKASVPTDAARIELAVSWAAYVNRAVMPGDVIVCEEPLSLQNGKTSRVLAMACSAIYVATYTLVGEGVPLDWAEWRWADVSHWKRTIIGNGNANKEQIEQWVKDNLSLEFPEPDFYDCQGILEFGKLWQILGEKPPTLPKKKRAKK